MSYNIHPQFTRKRRNHATNFVSMIRAHYCMRSLLAPDPIIVQSCVFCFHKIVFLIVTRNLCNHIIIHLCCQYIIKSGGTLNTIESSTNVHINLASCVVFMLKNRNIDNDNDKLQKRLISQPS